MPYGCRVWGIVLEASPRPPCRPRNPPVATGAARCTLQLHFRTHHVPASELQALGLPLCRRLLPTLGTGRCLLVDQARPTATRGSTQGSLHRSRYAHGQSDMLQPLRVIAVGNILQLGLKHGYGDRLSAWKRSRHAAQAGQAMQMMRAACHFRWRQFRLIVYASLARVLSGTAVPQGLAMPLPQESASETRRGSSSTR